MAEPLVGRDADVAAVARSEAPVLLLLGPTGVGKTALLQAVSGPRTLYVDAHEGAAAGVTAALQAGPGVDAWASALHARGIDRLLIDHADPEAAVRVARALWDCTGCRSVVASRRRLTGVATHAVGPLSLDAAVQLLSPGARPTAALRELAERLDRLPAALRLAAPWLSMAEPEQLTAEFTQSGPDADRLADAVAASLARLSPEARDAAARLALFRGSFDLAAALTVAPGAASALRELEAQQLLVADEAPRRLRLLSAARERLPTGRQDEDFRRAVRGLLERGAVPWPELQQDVAACGLLTEAVDAVRAGGAGPTLRRALEASGAPEVEALLVELDLEAAAFDRARARLNRSDRDDASWSRLRGDLAMRTGRWAKAQEWLDRARQTAPEALAPRVLLDLGLVALERGDDPRPWLEPAREGFLRLGDAAGASRASLRLGLAALRRGEASGVPTLHEALEAAEAAGAGAVAAVAAWYLAWASLEAGADEAAAAFLADAERLWAHRGNAAGLARVDGLRGVLGLLTGDLQAAAAGFAGASLVPEPASRARLRVLLLEAQALLAAAREEPWQQLLERARLLTAEPAGLARTAAVLAGEPDPGGPSRLRGRLLAAVARAPQEPRLHVARDGRTFRWEGSDAIDLSRRGAMRRILAALVAADGELDVWAIVDAGWPDGAGDPEAARARAYTAIRSLRRLGLERALVTRDGGYLLDPKLPRVVEGS